MRKIQVNIKKFKPSTQTFALNEQLRMLYYNKFGCLKMEICLENNDLMKDSKFIEWTSENDYIYIEGPIVDINGKFIPLLDREYIKPGTFCSKRSKNFDSLIGTISDKTFKSILPTGEEKKSSPSCMDLEKVEINGEIKHVVDFPIIKNVDGKSMVEDIKKFKSNDLENLKTLYSETKIAPWVLETNKSLFDTNVMIPLFNKHDENSEMRYVRKNHLRQKFNINKKNLEALKIADELIGTDYKKFFDKHSNPIDSITLIKPMQYLSDLGNEYNVYKNLILNSKNSLKINKATFNDRNETEILSFLSFKKNVNVEIILHKNVLENSYTNLLVAKMLGVKIYIDEHGDIKQNKFIIIDDKTLLSGTLNVDDGENNLIITSINLNDESINFLNSYINGFELRKGNCRQF